MPAFSVLLKCAKPILLPPNLLLFPVLHDKVQEVVDRGVLVQERVAAGETVLSLSGAPAAEEHLNNSKCTDEKFGPEYI